MAEPEDFEWDEEVQVLVTVRIKAKPNPEFYEGLQGRTPRDLAINAASRGGIYDLSRCDGYADMVGTADITDVEEGY